ncbi:hypothetical protein GCM10018789_63090 [Streptomyces werraensis]|nr:hypothetical protein GCM10018789_63090 [Streptomyces werraensis]
MPVTHQPWAAPAADGRPHGGAPAAPGRELSAAALRDGDEARGLARRLVGSLSAEARLVLLRALAEAGAAHVADRTAGPSDRGGAEPRPPRGTPPGGPWSGPQGGPWSDPPGGLIRLRFADVRALDRAGAAFGAGSGPGLGDAWSDPATLTLRMAGDAGVDSLRSVLAVLDAAAVTAESLTVHSRELDDVVDAFTALV